MKNDSNSHGQGLLQKLILDPSKLEKQTVPLPELEKYFDVISVYDLLLTLDKFGAEKYFSYEAMLSNKFLDWEKTRKDALTRSSLPPPPGVYGLGPRPKYSLSTLLEPPLPYDAPLTVSQIKTVIDTLPNDLLECYLQFSLSNIDQEKVLELLAAHEATNISSEDPFAAADGNDEQAYKYRLTYDTQTRELKLNGIWMAKTNFKSENDLFLRFFVAEDRTGEQLIEELEKFMGGVKLKKRPAQILSDLRLTGAARKVFFPNATKIIIEFRNPVTVELSAELNLPEIDLASLKQSEVVRNKQN